jgi:hypothetical protein
MLPVALMCTGKVCTLGLPTLTVSAGLGGVGVWAQGAPHNKDRLKQNAKVLVRDVAQGRRQMVGVMGGAPMARRSGLNEKTILEALTRMRGGPSQWPCPHFGLAG